ncbi:MAG: ASKHA domain-containing protein, partial [Pseudomonadota bacterium]
MKKYRVTFLPYDVSLEVDEGTPIAEAAQSADVSINNLCGGQGVCGQCKVRVMKGRAEPEAQARSLLTENELSKGFVLACRTEIHDDLEILIPAESRLEESQIMTGETEGISHEKEAAPLVRKIYLELPEPTIEDNISDIQRISRELRRKIGWHSFRISLNCLQHLSDNLRDHGWKVTAAVVKDTNGYSILKIDPRDTTAQNYGVAIDVGTTTVVAELVDITSGEVIGVEGAHNLQARYGEDVISRMIYACGKGGLSPLHEAVVKNINQLIEKLLQEHGIPREEINAFVAAGNTTMSHLLLNLVPCSIRLEPYVPTADIYPQIPARDIGIEVNATAVLETLPSVASYVGGDIVAGILACGMADHPEVKGLIDIGTNGEIAIGNNEWLVCCSASAGPAFEGGGTRCGMRATKG